MTSWITLYPDVYQVELNDVLRRFPDLRYSSHELLNGILVFMGELKFRSSTPRESQPFLLLYPNAFPYKSPMFYPLKTIPNSKDWRVDTVLHNNNILWMKAGYLRHQMPNGNLCLIEADSHNREDIIRGTEIIKRADQIFFSISRQEPFPIEDSEEAEMESHYEPAGDILLPQSFFTENLTGQGKFLAVWHYDIFPKYFAYVEQQDTHPRMLFLGLHIIQTTSGTDIEVGWEDARSIEEFKAFPWLAAWNTSFKDISIDSEFRDILIKGSWYDLDIEPDPVRNVAQLESILSYNGISDTTGELIKIGSNIVDNPERPIIIGLRYPSRTEGKEWLILKILTREEDKVTNEVLEREGRVGSILGAIRNANLSVIRSHILRRTDLERRNNTVGLTVVHDKTILLIGLGALGGDISETLAKAGTGKLICVDHDTLRSGNVIRHVGGLQLVGIKKSDVIKHIIHQHNPFVEVESIPNSITDKSTNLDELLDRSDLAVSTTADSNVDMVINEAAVRLRTPVIYGRAMHAGAISRVIRVRPGKDACLQCLALYRNAKETGSFDEDIRKIVREYVDIPPMEGEIVGRECGNPILAGSAVDLRITADLTARAALDEIAGGTEWNVLTWSRYPLERAIHPGLNQPYSTILQTIPPHPRCPICIRPKTKGVVISETQIDLIKKYTVNKSGGETGGVLIGFRDENNYAVVMEVTEAGPKAIESPTQFRWDDEYIQGCIDDAANRLGEKGLYVGEWHSHLDSDPKPSPMDVTSMTDIAQAPNFATNEPIMLIAGYDPVTGKIQKIHASCFPIVKLGRFVEIELEVTTDNQVHRRTPNGKN